MGDRVSLSFKDNDGDESVVLFHHWGGTDFPKVALDWFKGFKKDINSTAKKILLIRQRDLRRVILWRNFYNG